MPPPEINTYGMLRESSCSQVKGSFGFPERFMTGGTGVAYSVPGRGSVRFEGPAADIIVDCEGGRKKGWREGSESRESRWSWQVNEK
jgi:hypothetical protein